MSYQIEIAGRPCEEKHSTIEAAAAAYAKGQKFEIRQQGRLIDIVLIDDKGRYHGKAQISEVRPAQTAQQPTRRELERRHDATFNEGGYGYNPYRPLGRPSSRF